MLTHMSTDRYRTLSTLGWLYTAGFLGIFIICHTPGLTDARGQAVRPLPHRSRSTTSCTCCPASPARSSPGAATRYLPAYFIVIGVLYDLDAVVGMTMSRGLLDLSVFTQGPGAPDFSLTNWRSTCRTSCWRRWRYHRHRPAR